MKDNDLVQSREILIQLTKAFYRYRRAFFRQKCSTDLSPSETSILMSIYLDSSLNTASELIERLGTNKGLASRSIVKLRREQYLSSEVDSLDKRISRLSLTKKGFELCETLQRISREFSSLAFDGVSKQDMDTMAKTIEKMTENINRACQP